MVSENEEITFVLVENSPESRKHNVSNLPTLQPLLEVNMNETQTTKAEVLAELVK
jgi:hypothetical protein